MEWSLRLSIWLSSPVQGGGSGVAMDGLLVIDLVAKSQHCPFTYHSMISLYINETDALRTFPRGSFLGFVLSYKAITRELASCDAQFAK